MFIKIGNKIYLYNAKAYYLPRIECQNIFKYRLKYLDIKQKNIINANYEMPNLNTNDFKELLFVNDSERQILENCINNLHQHVMHPVIIVYLKDIETGKLIKRMHTMTHNGKDFKIEPTLTESVLGKTTKTANVIKITDTLYVSAHSWISEIDLIRDETQNFKYQELSYDPSLGYYVGLDTVTGKKIHISNLNLDGFNKVNNVIINNLQNQNKLVDITAMFYTSDDIVASKLLQSGIYLDESNIINKKNEIKEMENILSARYNFNLKEIQKSIIDNKEVFDTNKNDKKPEEEL